jgi:hypothetical protein
MNSIAYQSEFRPALPTVFGPKDYREFRKILEEMDGILTKTGIEHRLISKKVAEQGNGLSERQTQNLYRRYRSGFRYSLLLALTGYSYRELSIRSADSQLFCWFTFTEQLGAINPLSKSSLERYEKLFCEEELNQVIHDLNRAVADEKQVKALLYQEAVLKMDQIFADTTCVKANIHFPVDWVLLRDAARTLMKAIILIRKQGLYHRIGDPRSFLREMNILCIEMTHTRKKKGADKARKVIFRRMKKLMKVIAKHGKNYVQLLKDRFEETDWSEAEAQVVLNRMESVLAQLPDAIQQAHERIIGKRRVANTDKILSLYEDDIRVLVRGKAGAEVEFGNGLYLAEQEDGLIVDWKFIKEQPPGDNKLVAESIERLETHYGSVSSYAADRGFDSKDNSIDLEELQIINAICPRSVKALEQKLEDDVFCQLQTRRGSTEARIGIFKNAYLGKPLRSKGFSHRSIRIHWCICTHNLWKLAIKAVENQKRLEEEAQKAS